MFHICLSISDAVDHQRQQSEERSIKLKAMLVKIKRDLAEIKKELEVKTLSEAKLKVDLEVATQKSEEEKVEISQLMAEVHNLQEQVRKCSSLQRLCEDLGSRAGAKLVGQTWGKHCESRVRKCRDIIWFC